MSIPGPKTQWQRFWDSDSPWDIFSAAAALITGFSGAYKFFTTDPALDPNAYAWGVAVGGGVTLAGLSQLGKIVHRQRREAGKDSLHDLAGCLHTLNAVLRGVEDEKTVGLRSTIHVPQPNGKLLQALEYVGHQRKSKKTEGRELSMNVGVVGKTYREGEAFAGAREAGSRHEDFIRQMTLAYSFTEEQARDLDPSTESWMAAPILGKNGIDAVLYCDSVQREFFDKNRQLAVASAAVGIAYYIGVRYHD